MGVAKGETISNDQQGKVLWVWKGEEVFEQVTVQLTHTIDILVRIPESHSMLVASSSGLSVVSSDLTATPIEFEKPSKTSQLIKVLFLGRIFSSGSQVVNCGLVFDNGQVAFISIKGVDEEQDCGLAEGLVRDTKSLPAKTLCKGEKVADAFMDDKTLNVHFLTSKGTMIPNAMSLRVDSDIVPTTIFTLNKPANVKSDYFQGAMASIPDTAGPLLVYATPTTSDSCSLVLFEPTYPAVLTHRPIGSQSFNVRSIVPLSNNLFTLISSTKSGDKWSIHTVDLSAPFNGVGIAQLLDSGALTTRYFSQQTMAASTKAIAEPNATATQDDALLDSLRSALFSASNQDSAPALDVWNTWSRVQDHPFTRRRADRTRSTLASGGLASRGLLAGQVVNVVLEGALPRSARQERAIEGQDAAASLSGSNQAETWLTTGPQGPYLQSVVTELIENGWANDGMWSINMGGLVKGALLVLGDWDNIMLACERLPLIPSPSLVSLLWHVLEYHHRQSDSGTTKETGLAAPPSLVDFLKAYMTIPISPAMHKASLKSGLTRVEDVQAVLEVLVSWLEEVGKMEESRGFKWSESVQQVPDKYPVDRVRFFCFSCCTPDATKSLKGVSCAHPRLLFWSVFVFLDSSSCIPNSFSMPTWHYSFPILPLIISCNDSKRLSILLSPRNPSSWLHEVLSKGLCD